MGPIVVHSLTHCRPKFHLQVV